MRLITKTAIIIGLTFLTVLTALLGSFQIIIQGSSVSNEFLIWPIILSMIIISAATITLQRVLIRPIQALNDELNRVGSSGSLLCRIATRSDDEIGDLTESLNAMLTQLEGFEREKSTTEGRLSRLFELVQEGICVVGSDGRIWFANPKLAEMFETSIHDLTGMEIKDLLMPEGSIESQHQDQISEISERMNEFTSIMEFILSQRIRNYPLTEPYPEQEFHTYTKSRRELVVRVSSAPFPLATGKNGLICVLADVTKYKKVEKDLLLSNRKLSLLGSMTRHDIVNQLTSVRGMIALAMKKNQDERIAVLLRTAEESADKIGRHIEFSKEYQKAGIEEPRWQDVKSVWNLSYAMSKRQGMRFYFEGVDYEIYADQLLQKAFYNLIDNSIRHGKEMKELFVRTDLRDNKLAIIYQDDGCGIREDMKERIFERGVGTGTGWGLFLVKETLELTDIKIQETGVYGTGAKFEIIVPEGNYREIRSE